MKLLQIGLPFRLRIPFETWQTTMGEWENDMNFQAAHDIIDALQVVKINFLDFVQIKSRISRAKFSLAVLKGKAARRLDRPPCCTP